MILGEILVPGKSLQCDACNWQWKSIASILPVNCPKCRSREWNGKKMKRKPARGPSIQLPKPIKLKWVEEETDL